MIFSFLEKQIDPGTCHALKIPQLPEVNLTGDITIAQILAMLYKSGHSLATPHIILDLVSVRVNCFFLLYKWWPWLGNRKVNKAKANTRRYNHIKCVKLRRLVKTPAFFWL